MFNSTHTLVGIALSRTRLGREVPRAALVGAVAANLPDIEGFWAFSGGAVYLDYHRGITHSLAGVVLILIFLALVLGAARSLLSRRRHRPPPERYIAGPWGLMAVAVCSHPLLDFTNAYGLRPLIPFDYSWYHGDLVFIISPFLDIALLATIIAGYVQKRRAARWGASGLLFVALFWVVSGWLHQRAIHVVRGVPTGPEPVVRVAALPRSWLPNRWTGIIETATRMERLEIQLGWTQSAVHGRWVLEKPEAERLRSLASESYAMAVFLDFSRFPVCQEQTRESGKRVICFDLGFYSPERRGGFAADALYDEDGRLVSSDFDFNMRLDTN